MSSGDNAKKFSSLYSCRRGQLINGVALTCLHASKSLSALTVKLLLIILPKCSLIESRQCWESEEKLKQREDAAIKGENKSLMPQSWGPLKVGRGLRSLYITRFKAAPRSCQKYIPLHHSLLPYYIILIPCLLVLFSLDVLHILMILCLV